MRKNFYPVKFFIEFIIWLSVICLLSKNGNIFGQKIKIDRLKNLHINTILVEAGKPNTIIVIPGNGIYDDAAKLIQDAIRNKSGIEISVNKEEPDPEVILGNINVIVLGNMTTNRFIYKLYCQWYTLLDTKYPGKGGYVVRSLHDPYGTGKNVIEIGGSENTGVLKASERFCALLPSGKSMIVGRLMDIKLGEGLVPPKIEKDGTGLKDVLTWIGNDWASKGTDSGFGWNPISLSGILYYMTGNQEYIDCFKNLVKPDPDNIPAAVREFYSFVNLKRPLVEQVEEYTDHIVDFVWDLIEDSPLFTDEDRLYVTGELLDHQYFRDPNHSFVQLSPGRHPAFALLGIFSGSRYFAKYYPDPVWDKRLENVRKSYNSFIGNPTFGNDNMFYWASCVQYIFDYFVMSGYDDFVRTGTAKTYMDALMAIRTGEKYGDYYNGITPFLLNLAAYMLKDNGYFWLLNELDYNDNVFRVGRSFWQSDDIVRRPPDNFVNKFISFPLKAKGIPSGEGFEAISYCSGLSNKDDFLQIDGHNGGGRSSYHLNSILKLRMFDGNYLLEGINNDIDITCNGMADSVVAVVTSLKTSAAFNDFAYVRTEVPEMTKSIWQRNLLYIKNCGLVVADRITAKEDASLEIQCSWTFPKDQIEISFKPEYISTKTGTIISYANPCEIKLERGNIVKEIFGMNLKRDEYYNIVNLIYHSENPDNPSSLFRTIDKNCFLVTGNSQILICMGDYFTDQMKSSAEFVTLEPDRIFLADVREFNIKEKVKVKSEVPLTILWNIKEYKVEIIAPRAGTMYYELGSQGNSVSLSPGKVVYEDITPPYQISEKIREIQNSLAQNIVKRSILQAKKEKTDKIKWQPNWQVKGDGDASLFDFSLNGVLWVAWDNNSAYRIRKLNDKGEILKEITGDGKILSLWAAKNESQAKGFSVLAGFIDDTLRAYSQNGIKLWAVKAELDPIYIIGDKYVAPWFSDPKQVSGVYKIYVDDLWGKGNEEIVIGRPVTLEFRSLDGKLISRLPTKWGTNTNLQVLKSSTGNNYGNLVLAGKFITGYPGISIIKGDYMNISDDLFNGVMSGWTSMDGWGQQGMSQLIVDDINNDGYEEVISTITGHWNELRVWKGKITGPDLNKAKTSPNYSPVMSGGTASRNLQVRNDPPIWMKYFGSNTEGTWIIQGILQRDPLDKMKDMFVSSLVVSDLNSDGFKEIGVGLRNGWLHIFDHKGKLLWQKRFGSGVKSMTAVEKQKGKLMAGLSDGSIYLMDGTGIILKTGKMDSSVEKIMQVDSNIIVGTQGGIVAGFAVK